MCAHVSEGDIRKGKCNTLVADINFKVNNKISSWQQTVELYFDENCWQILQQQGFSPCGKLKICDVFSCACDSDFTSAPSLDASSTSEDLHPSSHQTLKILHKGGLFVHHFPKVSASFLPGTEIWMIRTTVNVNIQLAT